MILTSDEQDKDQDGFRDNDNDKTTCRPRYWSLQ